MALTSRRSALRRLADAALLPLAATATVSPAAAGFPHRAVTLWVPWPAGGATDLTMRLLADVGKFPMMLFKRKLSILPPWVGGRAARKALFRRARASASAAESQIGGKP